MSRAEPVITTFADALVWLAVYAGVRDYLQIELIEKDGIRQAAFIYQERTSIAVSLAGGMVPEEFDVLLLLGENEALAKALPELPVNRRILTHTLPTPQILLRRVVEESLQVASAYTQAKVKEQLIDVGLALNLERSPRRVLELILTHARNITGADAGSIYVLEEGGTSMRLSIAHNDSVDADYTEFSFPISEESIVGTSVQSGKIINLRDLYSVEGRTALGRTFNHDRSLDRRFGYQTRSMLTVPMRSPEGNILGAFQLINAKRDHESLQSEDDFVQRVFPFAREDERLCSALATQGAVALENANLYNEIQQLFESFVRASVIAIEQRDPTTSGHSQRVADLTVELAKVIDRSEQSAFRDVHFTSAQLREIEYAGLLHDFGKVGVREQVLVKAKKLHDGQLDTILARFEHMRTSLRLHMFHEQLELARRGQLDDHKIKAMYASALAEIDELKGIILAANEPTILAEEVSSKIREVAQRTFVSGSGQRIRLIEDHELAALLVPRGSLTEEERIEVQNHVRYTYDFLVQIPWSRNLANIPEIAIKHHEYLDGSGYPAGLTARELPIQARMMTVADIFDALTAADRPYKKAVPVVHALSILEQEAKQGKLDKNVLQAFIDAQVYKAIGMDL